jgi:hypothetical protein
LLKLSIDYYSFLNPFVSPHLSRAYDFTLTA